MDTKELYREILNEHNLNPSHKKDLPGATCVLNGVNPSCGDKITLNLKVEDGKIADASYVGSGCAQWWPARIAIFSVSKMLEMSCG